MKLDVENQGLKVALIIVATFVDVLIAFSAGCNYKIYAQYNFGLSEKWSSFAAIFAVVLTMGYIRFNHKIREYIVSEPSKEEK